MRPWSWRLCLALLRELRSITRWEEIVMEATKVDDVIRARHARDEAAYKTMLTDNEKLIFDEGQIIGAFKAGYLRGSAAVLGALKQAQ